MDLEFDEGVIKFDANWHRELPRYNLQWRAIESIRYRIRYLGYLGAYSNGISYGNISLRLKKDCFFISASATSHKMRTTPMDYSLVYASDVGQNTVSCMGPMIASSESMTHATIYRASDKVNAIIHVHNNMLWKNLASECITTDEDIAYGTEKMANEVLRIVSLPENSTCGIIVMLGHVDGIIFYGKNLDEASALLFEKHYKLTDNLL